jgi:GntR family transcriptional repressor for pyruvate dehydrogenase complex
MEIFARLANRSLLSKSVEDAIEQAIQGKKLEAGTRLPSEMKLCQQFGVSRTVIREALRVLHSRGLITIVKGKGMFVKELSGQTAADPLHLYLQMNFERSYVMDIVYSRQILEPAIAELAAKHRSDEDIRRLADDIELLRTCTGDFSELSKTDTQFHVDIAKACGNSLMPLLLEPIHRLIPDIKSSVYATVNDAKESALIMHQSIYDAIAAGNPVGARKAMEEHLRIAEDHAERMLKAKTQHDKD